MPLFPPTYKRRKGDHEGSCGDYTDPACIIRGFTNTGEAEDVTNRNEHESMKGKPPFVDPTENIIGSKTSVLESSDGDVLKGPQRFYSDETVDSVEFKEDDKECEEISNNVNTPNIETRPHSDSNAAQMNRISRRIANVVPTFFSQDGPNKELTTANSIVLSATTIHESFNTIGTNALNLIKKQIDPRALRPPSYTDRILFHSLQDQSNRITVQAYDLCDKLRISDHRAVSMVVLLEVNSIQNNLCIYFASSNYKSISIIYRVILAIYCLQFTGQWSSSVQV